MDFETRIISSEFAHNIKSKMICICRHHEAVSHFEALLVDLIRQPDYTWKEAKRILKKDAR